MISKKGNAGKNARHINIMHSLLSAVGGGVAGLPRGLCWRNVNPSCMSQYLPLPPCSRVPGQSSSLKSRLSSSRFGDTLLSHMVSFCCLLPGGNDLAGFQPWQVRVVPRNQGPSSPKPGLPCQLFLYDAPGSHWFLREHPPTHTHTPPPALSLAISAGNRPSGLSSSRLVVFFFPWHLLFSFLL